MPKNIEHTCFVSCFFALTNVQSQINAPTLTSVFSDPGLTNPKLRFHTGGVVNNAPEISKDLPNIDGLASSWYFAQWRQCRYRHSS